MTKSALSRRSAAPLLREPRPFLFLEPARLPLSERPHDPIGVARLDTAIEAAIGELVRAIVGFTIARHNRTVRRQGAAEAIPLSVLNRRRRAARSWLLAIAAGEVDGATRHAVATQWLPLLCGTGPDLQRIGRPARTLIEFVRGAATAALFDAPAANLLTHARALHVLETTLAVHLAAVLEVARSAALPQGG